MRYNKLIQAIGAVCGLTSFSVALSPEPPIYQIIRGEYEDKIRRYSPPQKNFSVFARVDQNKNYTMTLSDLLKACLLYNYSESDIQKISNYRPQNIIKLMGKENNFQIYDYSNFVRFVYAQKQPFEEFMQKKNIKNLTKQSFLQLLVEQICKDTDGFIRQPLYIESRQFNPRKDDNLNTCKRMVESLFKNKSSYSLKDIIQFKKELMKELFVFEFRSFKIEGDAIDGVDFARSIVKYTQNNHKRKFLRKIFLIEQKIKDLKIKQKEYVNFHSHFVFNQKQIEAKLNEKGAINRKQLNQILDLTSDSISSQQTDILFSLLDSDNSDFLQKREVLGVVSELSRSWKTKPGDTTLTGLAKQRFEKFVNKSKQIIDIILQE